MTTTFATLDTPCAILDLTRLERNISRMRDVAAGRGCRLRPHLKTAKNLAIARLAAPDRDSPIAVSTMREAEAFSADGYRDIFYTVLLGPGKMTRIARLLSQSVRLFTAIDGLPTAHRLRAVADEEHVTFQTLIEINCGENRGGVEPGSAELVQIARALGEHFAGVTTHGGHAYAARSDGELVQAARDEVAAVRNSVAALDSAGIKCRTVSIGSTPTALTQIDLAGITELRAGVYMFGDLFQAGLGSCAVDDLALSVLAEVISCSAGKNEFLIDAGAIALSKDHSTAALPKEQQAGFGRVCDLTGRLLDGLTVVRLWQEHGLVASTNPLTSDAYPVGTRLRILPNHACLTAAAHDSYRVVAGTGQVITEWPRINGW